MNTRVLLLVMGSMLLSVACSSSDPLPADTAPSAISPDNESVTTGIPASGTQASYRLTFIASWSEATHPLNFPGNPHFSGLVGAVHNEQVRFWEPGQFASEGIEQMAETGGKSGLIDEVNQAISEGTATALLDGGGVGSSPGMVTLEFVVTRDYPQISVTSMLAPSPDWFVGLHNFSLLDDSGEFVDTASIELRLYDSNTDDGTRYVSPNAPTVSPGPIMLVTSDALDAPFINGQPSVGTFIIQRLESEAP